VISWLGDKKLTQLTLEEARYLAGVFGEVDWHTSVLLLLFQEPSSVWEILPRVEKFPKSYRVPQATIYRKVKGLYDASFLDLVDTRRGRGGMPVSTYRLSLKGRIAAGIFTYVLFSDPKTPDGLKENTGAEKLVQILESSPGWALHISFLRWHRDRRIDLSEAKIDMAYFSSILALSLLEHPESVTEERMRELAEVVKKLGIVPQVEPKEIPALFRDAKDSFRELETKVLEPLLGRTELKSTVKKEAQS